MTDSVQSNKVAPGGGGAAALGLAIVGCGQIVTHHISGMLRLVVEQQQSHTPNDPNQHCTDETATASSGWFQVRALVDPNPERLPIIQKYLQETGNGQLVSSSVQQFHSLEDMLSQDHRSWLDETIDVIFIAVPHDLHETLALRALQSTTRQCIVLEKPLAVTHESCQRLVRASMAQQGRLLVAEQSPYWEEVVCARQLIRNGAIGDTLVAAAAYYYESMRDNVTSGSVEQDGGLGWRGQVARAGGGIAMDGGLHWIRPLRELCGGRIQRVVGVVRHGLAPALQMEGESVGHALFELDPESTFLQSPPVEAGPLVATYSCNMLATAPMAHDCCPYFRITGNAGEVIIHGDGLLRQAGAGGVRLYNDQHPLGAEQFPSDRVGGFFLGFAGLWRELARILQENDTAAAHETVVRAADDVGVVLALYKSSQTRQWEEV